jgi:hypothetical protein
LYTSAETCHGVCSSSTQSSAPIPKEFKWHSYHHWDEIIALWDLNIAIDLQSIEFGQQPFLIAASETKNLTSPFTSFMMSR